ncbi:hypothetical protein D3Z36_13625 [Lachnospiraceae bacterium]|nr:hypothetical protein [Lachnospiraceae bacterium]
MIIIFDIIIFAYGIYAVYAAVNMKKTRRLTRFFIGGNNTPVRDTGGYIDAIYAKTIVMGSVAALFGGAGFVNDYIIPLPELMKALMLLFITVLIWFGVSQSQAKRKFW